MSQDNRQQTNLTDLHQENQRLLLLQRISLIAAEKLDRPTLLLSALVELQQFFSVDGGGIYQFDHINSPRSLIANFGIPAELVRILQKIPVGKGLTEQVIVSRSACSWVDLRCEPQLYCPDVLDAGWRSLISLPLIADGQISGVLFLFQRISRQFSGEDIELLNQACTLLASAIAASELLEKLKWQQQKNEAVERELQRSRAQLRAHLYRLEESNLALEQINRSKTHFLGVASHELRTPLTCILAATEMLQIKLPKASDEVIGLLNMLEQGGVRLQILIEDLLEMARIEAGDLYLANEPLDLSQILTELQFDLRLRANGRKITLTLGALPETCALQGDDYHLRRALNRLLDNALKFTPKNGRIHLETSHYLGSELHKQRLHLEKFCPDFFFSAPAKSYILLQIIDNGIGIDEEQRLLIFDTFHGATSVKHHGRNQTTGSASGAGLGLSLAKGIIEEHGGMIWVDSSSEQESGSVFNVLLPLCTHRPKSVNGP